MESTDNDQTWRPSVYFTLREPNGPLLPSVGHYTVSHSSRHLLWLFIFILCFILYFHTDNYTAMPVSRDVVLILVLINQ